MTSNTPVVFVNVVSVDPEHQEEAVAVLLAAIDEVVQHRPGFIGATVLASLDGTRVVNWTRWTDAQAVAATSDDPASRARAARLAALGEPSASIYAVVAEVGR